MKRCRTCNKDWPDAMNACPDDGTSLTAAFDATYHAPSSPPAPGPTMALPGGYVAPPAAEVPPPQSDLLAGAIVGEYKVDKKIGEGGMGAVYSATHPMIGKRAAIKVISTALGNDASAVNRFVNEARSVNQIGHPNIVDVFAFGVLPDGRNYFVMEYLQGESLADRIQRAPMPLGEALELIDQVADALEAAHEKQIVHRDLKPDNVYLAAVRGGRTMVKVLDFGIAKLSAADGPGTGGGIAKTRTGMMMGTPGYISPEQARGKNVDHRTDIYALGCMLFEIVCGRLPFMADNAMDIVLMHMTAPPPRPSSVWPDIPPALDELIYRMLDKDMNARPSLAEVRAGFSELVTSGLVTLNNGRGVAFGSSMGRSATPGGGMMRPATSPGLAAGTQPAQPRPPTGPSGAAPVEAPKKKTGLVAALIGGVVVLGGIGAFVATQGGGEDKPKEAVAAPTPEPAPTPAPEPPKPAEPVAKPVEPPKPVEPAAKTGGTIELKVNVDGATVTVDGKPVEITGKKTKVAVETDGPHVVVVSAPKHETHEETVEVAGGSTTMLPIKLERARAGGGGGRKGDKAGTTATTTPAAGSGKGSATSTQPPPPTDKNAPINPF